MKNNKANSNAAATPFSKAFGHRRQTVAALMVGMSLFCLTASNTFAYFTLPGLGKLVLVSR